MSAKIEISKAMRAEEEAERMRLLGEATLEMELARRAWHEVYQRTVGADTIEEYNARRARHLEASARWNELLAEAVEKERG